MTQGRHEASTTFAYEVADGQITAIREYMDTRGGWLQVFGDDRPEILMQGTPPDS
jgi:ketosteroid isomerase-like protein